jgi:hypothetical protein
MTTGQPIKTPSDRNKFDNEFMDSLRRQIRLNDQNLQANRLYQNTGQLPPSVQMADTRSITEKLADVEGLKASIAADLKVLAEPAFCYDIIQSVQNSPLNIDNSLLRFLAQNANQIGIQLSKKYKFGIRGDANDCAIITNFIADAYNTMKTSMQSIKGYINNNNNSSNSKNNILSSNDMDRLKVDLTDFLKRLHIMKIPDELIQLYVPHINDLIDVINTVTRFIPNTEQLSEITNYVSSNPIMEPQYLINRGYENQQDIRDFRKQEELKQVFNILSDMPNVKTVQNLLSQLYQSVKNRNTDLFFQIITSLNSLFEPFTQGRNFDILDQFANRYLRIANYMGNLKKEQTISQIKDINRANIQAAKADRVYIVNPEDDPVYVTDGIAKPQVQEQDLNDYLGNAPANAQPIIPIGAGQHRRYVRQEIQGLNNAQLQQVAQFIDANENRFRSVVSTNPAGQQQFNDILDDIIDHVNGHVILNQNNLSQRLQYILEDTGNIKMGYDPSSLENSRIGIAGLGLKKKGRGISSDYRDFGINKINHKKLDDGILTLRRKSNSNIPDMPSKRISRKLQKIIKHISGGGMPDFNEVNNLENHEKDYLHKLISKSNLTDRLSVPAPSKDQEEKDFHQFEVMKGEIMSGNDSKELVKKFKVLILKLSKQNILPKNEVNELLQDLLSLGY